MIRRIVVGYDFSEASDDALAWAVELARPLSATVALVHVVNVETDEDPALNEARSQLAHIADEAGPEVASHVLRAPSVAPALAHFCEEHGADLLAVSSAGLGGVARWLLGSVADAVVRSAPCPVVTLRTHPE